MCERGAFLKFLTYNLKSRTGERILLFLHNVSYVLVKHPFLFVLNKGKNSFIKSAASAESKMKYCNTKCSINQPIAK